MKNCAIVATKKRSRSCVFCFGSEICYGVVLTVFTSAVSDGIP
jgi:hypothetical protein